MQNSSLIALAIIIGAMIIAGAIVLTLNKPAKPIAPINQTSTISTITQQTSQLSTLISTVQTTVATSVSVSTTSTTTIPVAQSETWLLQGFVIGPKAGNEQDLIVAMPDIIKYANGTYRMYYSWANPSPGSAPATAIKSATSTDGIHWAVESGYRIQGNSSQSQSQYVVGGPSVVTLANGTYRMYYDAEAQQSPGKPPQYQIYSAISKDGYNFRAEGLRIAISLQTGIYLAGHGKFFLLSNGTYIGVFSGNTNSTPGPSSLIMTTSTDGLNWGNYHLIYTNFHDPTIFQVNGTYNMYATYLATSKAHAISTDGIHWPLNMVNVNFQAQNGTLLTEGNSGVGDIGGAILPNGAWAIYTDWQNPSQNLVYFTKR